MKITKALMVLFVILSIMCSTIACSRNSHTAPVEDGNNSLKIYTTFYPLYDFTKKIVGSSADVENLIPAGVEPHDFELSPKQAANIYDADIFIFLGESMEPWATKIAHDLDKQGIRVIEAGKGLIENHDPHIWLDPVLASKMAKRIFDGIVSVDKEHEEVYTDNLTQITKKLDELDNSFKQLISGSQTKDIVTSHAFFSYAARRYGFNQLAITGLSPQEEPSMKKRQELKDFCDANNIKYIVAGQGENSKLVQILSQDTGAEILELNPLETLRNDEIQAGEDYFSVMEKNLEVLKTALNYKQ
ncbi:MAG: zinc ABC transporter solute-binding protein [Thermoanaerobacteraceae bacterium]|nr:zinc ABC transporter solute-binding protein [Thermoanaerobacteraceae bacterium]